MRQTQVHFCKHGNIYKQATSDQWYYPNQSKSSCCTQQVKQCIHVPLYVEARKRAREMNAGNPYSTTYNVISLLNHLGVDREKYLIPALPPSSTCSSIWISSISISIYYHSRRELNQKQSTQYTQSWNSPPSSSPLSLSQPVPTPRAAATASFNVKARIRHQEPHVLRSASVAVLRIIVHLGELSLFLLLSWLDWGAELVSAYFIFTILPSWWRMLWLWRSNKNGCMARRIGNADCER